MSRRWRPIRACKRVHEGEEFLPGIAAFDAPGHTPGSLVFHLTANEVPVIFTGDAAKNRAELISRKVDMSLDEAASTAFDRPDLGAVARRAGDDRHSRARPQHAAG